MGRLPDANSDQPCSTVRVGSRSQQVDRLLDALGTYRRRCVLYHLVDDTPTTLDELVDGVVAMETGRQPDDVPADVHDIVKSDLYHNTLPKLAELGVVEYNPQNKTVSYHHPPPHIETFLELTRDLDPVSAN